MIKQLNESKTELLPIYIDGAFFLAHLSIPLYPIKKNIWKYRKLFVYLYHKTERRCIYNVTEKNINVFIRSKQKYLEITKTICIFVSRK